MSPTSPSAAPQLRPLQPLEGIEIWPVQHGQAVFAAGLRELLWRQAPASLAIALPESLQAAAMEGAASLPKIHAVTIASEGRLSAYLPLDPCDAYVEAMRQAQQRRLPLRFVEDDALLSGPWRAPTLEPLLLPALGMHAFAEKSMLALRAWEPDPRLHKRAETFAQALLALRELHGSVLGVCGFSLLPRALALLSRPVRNQTRETALWQAALSEPPAPPELNVVPVHPKHLQFALGEPPFHAAQIEEERRDPFALPLPYLERVKRLFVLTRSRFLDDPMDAKAVTFKRLQSALQFVRNLSALDGRLTPALYDMAVAAKGVFGDRFAARFLDAARAYPFQGEPEDEEGWFEVGPELARSPEYPDPAPAFNLLQETERPWRRLSLKREPEKPAQDRYRYGFDGRGVCSHLPEDVRIERFNRTLRRKGMDSLEATRRRTEPMSASLKDGVDVRETLRHFATGEIHVREIPPSRGRVDTVVIVFDDAHDERYTNRMAWAFEHPDESMLTFFATPPLDRMIGPGIAEAEYGGLSLLFPPRLVPDIFRLPPSEFGFRNLTEQLTYGALLHSREKAVVFAADRKPGARLQSMAREFGKRLVHIPLATFGSESLRRLRRFHILNGKQVRSWASRFIPE